MGPTVRRQLGRVAELAALCGLTVAQPVLSTFGENATDLVFRRTSGTDLILFALLVITVPPLVLGAVETAVAATDEHWGTVVHHTLVGVLVGVFAMQIVKDFWSVTGPAMLLIGFGVAGLALIARARFDRLGEGLRYLAIAPVLFAVNFLFLSPASGILAADGTADAAQLSMDAPGDLIVLVFDELPTLSLLDENDEVDAELWPAFAELAAQSTWYRNATSVSPTTPTAVPSLFTGRLPEQPGEHQEILPLLDDHPQNVFTLFARTHDIRAHESVTQLCPASACADQEATGGTIGSLLDDGVDVWWRFTSPEEAEVETIDFKPRQSDPTADDKINAWLDTIPSAGTTDRPLLAVLHALWPHQPWWRTPDGLRYDAPVVAEGLGSQYSWGGDTAPLAARQRHLMQLQYTDRQLATIIAVLKDRGRWDDATVVLTADHGISFSTGDPIRGLGEANASAVAWVPMFVKAPGQTAGTIDDRPTSTLDLVPTLLDAVGAEAPWALDGLAVTTPRTDDERLFADWSLSTREPDRGFFATIDGAAGYRALLDAEPVVPPGPDPDLRLYQWGQFGDLVGRPLQDFDIGEASGYTVAVEETDALADHDPDTDRIPVYISGFVEPDEPADFAIVMNGTIAMWGRSEVTRRGHRIWGTVVPDTIQPGFNDVQLFEIVDHSCRAGADPVACVTLAPVALTAAPDEEE